MTMKLTTTMIETLHAIACGCIWPDAFPARTLDALEKRGLIRRLFVRDIDTVHATAAGERLAAAN